MRALSTRNDEPERASRPFDKDRDGFVIGEGAGVLVLEELESARGAGRAHLRRDRRLRHVGRRLPHHRAVRGRRRRGARRCAMALAQRRRRRRRRVDYINAHGTSTPLNDKLETLAIKQLLRRARRRSSAMSSTKSMTGHLLGAAGGLEAGITALAVLPPDRCRRRSTWTRPDPECDLDYVPWTARDRRRSRTRCRTRSGSAAPTPRCSLAPFRRLTPGAVTRAMKIAVCIKQVPTRDWQPRVNEHADLGPRPGRQLRDERARRLRARRGPAAEGEARRRSGGLLGGPGPRGAGDPRGAGPRRRPRHPRRGRRRWRTADAFAVAEALAAAMRDERVRPRAHRPAVRRPGLRPDRRGAGRAARHRRTRPSSWKCDVADGGRCA